MSVAEKIEEALGDLVDFYAKQKKSEISDGTVIQGRSFSAASELQRNLAEKLFGNDRDKKVLVDYPISFGKYKTSGGGTKKKTVYADIAVRENGFLTALIKVKIDLGLLSTSHYGLSARYPNEHAEKDEDLRDWSKKIKQKIKNEISLKIEDISLAFEGLIE